MGRLCIKMKEIPDNLYKKIMNFMPILCLDFLCIVKDKKEFQILLAKRKNSPAKGFYYVLGGRHTKDKNIFLDIKSKIMQELNINIDCKKLFFTGIINERFEDSIFQEVKSTTVSLSFASVFNKEEIKKFNIKLDSQNSNYKFFNFNEIADSKEIHPFCKKKIIQAEHILKEFILKKGIDTNKFIIDME